MGSLDRRNLRRGNHRSIRLHHVDCLDEFGTGFRPRLEQILARDTTDIVVQIKDGKNEIPTIELK